jgi:hypothetical protein
MPPIEFLLHALLYGVAVPAAVTAALLLLPLRLRPGLGEPAVRCLGALAVAAGFVAGGTALGLLPLRPELPWDWLPWLGLAAVASAAPLPGLLRVALWLSVAALTAWRVVPVGDGGEVPVGRCRLTIAMGVLTLGLLAPLARRRPGPLVPLLLALVAAGGAVVIEQSANAKYAQLAGTLAAALGAVALAAVVSPNRAVATGAVLVTAVLLPGLLAEGYFNNFGDVPLTSFVLAAATPLGLAVPELPGLRALSPRWSAAVRMLAVLVPLAVAVVLGLRAEE